ncbi:hypothetical protein WDU94_002538 [Cyamophila willieti]
MTIPTKPKIGFSIDSIVGSAEKINNNNTESCRTGGSSPKLANDCNSSIKSGGMMSPKETYLSRSSRSPSRSSRSPTMYLPHHQVHPNHHHLALAAAQHFQAANIAAALGNNNQHGPAPNVPPRDTYPLYPWLLSRHGRIFPHRFPGGKC